MTKEQAYLRMTKSHYITNVKKKLDKKIRTTGVSNCKKVRTLQGQQNYPGSGNKILFDS